MVTSSRGRVIAVCHQVPKNRAWRDVGIWSTARTRRVNPGDGNRCTTAVEIKRQPRRTFRLKSQILISLRGQKHVSAILNVHTETYSATRSVIQLRTARADHDAALFPILTERGNRPRDISSYSAERHIPVRRRTSGSRMRRSSSLATRSNADPFPLNKESASCRRLVARPSVSTSQLCRCGCASLVFPNVRIVCTPDRAASRRKIRRVPRQSRQLHPQQRNGAYASEAAGCRYLPRYASLPYDSGTLDDRP